jgi:type VI secretion system secreted protein Hcp
MKHRNTLAKLTAGLFLLVTATAAIAASPCNLKIAEYPGSSEKEGREDTSDVYAVDHELIQPYDPTTGAASGVRQHRPLTVLKMIDKATPGLHKALATGQTLNTAVLDCYRIDPATRQDVKYYTITLREVRIVGMKTIVPTTFLSENANYGHMEEVRMVYETIEWNWIPDSVVEQDDWQRHSNAPGLTAPAATSAKSALARPATKP